MIKRLLVLSRPRFWFYLGGTFLLGASLGASSVTDLHTPLMILCLFYFFPIANLFVYGINDLHDEDTDQFNEKKRGKELRFHRKKDQYLETILFYLLVSSIPLMVALPNAISKVFFALFLFLSFAYSAPPFRFKAKPVLDFVSNALYLMPGYMAYAMLTEEWPNILAVIAGLCWVMAMHLYSAIPDIEPDRKAGVKTSAVQFGAQKSLILCFVFWGICSFIVIWNQWFGLISWLLLIYPIMSIYTALHSKKIHKLYWYFPALNVLMGGIGFLYVFLPLV